MGNPHHVDQKTASDICRRAANLVNGERDKAHGPTAECHANIAAHWTAYLGSRLSAPLSPRDVALMMAELKIARTKSGDYNPDDYVDGVGYLAIAGELAAKE